MRKKAMFVGAMYLLLALVPLAMLAGMLASTPDPAGQLSVLFVESAQRRWFAWFLLGDPLACLALAAAYARTTPASSPRRLFVLAVAGCLFAAVAWLTLNLTLAALATLAAISGTLLLRESLATRQAAPPAAPGA